MSYCVNCGVELAPSEPKCPLCGTPVIHPDRPWQAPEERLYPERLETTAGHVNRRYGAHLASIALLMPVAVCMLVDFLTTMHITWSFYVMGAGAFIFCCALLPFYTEKPKPYLSLFLDMLAALLYLYLIALASGDTAWFWRLAMPLTVFSGLAVIACVWIFRRKNSPFLVDLSNAIAICAALLIIIECMIDLFVIGFIRPRWSLYALFPLIALSVMFRMVNRKQRLLESIRKRLYV